MRAGVVGFECWVRRGSGRDKNSANAPTRSYEHLSLNVAVTVKSTSTVRLFCDGFAKQHACQREHSQYDPGRAADASLIYTAAQLDRLTATGKPFGPQSTPAADLCPPRCSALPGSDTGRAERAGYYSGPGPGSQLRLAAELYVQTRIGSPFFRSPELGAESFDSRTRTIL